MSKEIGIAEAEWQVMELLWENPMLTIGDIKKGLEYTKWSDSTIKTLVRRLTAKGIVGIDDTKGQFRYFSIVKESECRMKETKNLINKIYHGSVKMLMASLIPESNLTEEEAKQIMDIINKIEE